MQLESTIRRVKWERPGNTWRLIIMENGDTWKGTFPDNVFAGDLLKAEGEWVTDKYGRAFEVSSTLLHVAKSNDGIMAWLKYRLPHIGEERARAIVTRFGSTLWDVIERTPHQLTTLPGITKERADEIAQAYSTFKREQQIISSLVNHGMKIGLAMRAFRHFGDTLASVLERDPYELMDVDGITFDVADEPARKMGLTERDPRRMRAWARQQLENELGNGHCFLPSMKLIGGLTKWGYTFAQASQILRDSPHLTIRGNAVMLSRIDYAERSIAAKVTQMKTSPLGVLGTLERVEIPDWLDESQQRAVLALINEPICILTGGPGTGKTTSLKTALDILESQGSRVRLVAPTGKAAKRMSTVTERPASTIHRMLGWSQDGNWGHNALNPIQADVVVVDESSMVDISLAASLFEALGDARLILVGDVKQLPPVGPGQPLFDLIESKQVPTFVLNTIHRQAGDSWVIDNARKIINGEVPSLEPSHDFELEYRVDSDDIVEFILQVCHAYPETQVLTPEHKNGAGTIRLNNDIQSAVNPKNKFAPFAQCGDYKIYEGDKVLYTKNHSELGLVNGDTGKVQKIQGAGKDTVATVKFEDMTSDLHPDGVVDLSGGDLSPLTLAYAMTVHKCVSPDTIVETPVGLMRISELSDAGQIATAEGVYEYNTLFARAPGKLFRIITAEGYSVDVTPEHRLMAWTGERYEPVPAEEITPGTFLRLKLGETCEGVQELDLHPPTTGDVRETIYPVPQKMSEDLAELLGLLVADGTLYERGFRLAKRHKDVCDRFGALVGILFGREANTEILYESSREIYVTEVSSTYLTRWLTGFDGVQPGKKAIPRCVLRSEMKIQKRFLRGLFEDGTVNIKSGVLDHIEWGTCSGEMARLVQIMLLRFGIISSRKPGAKYNKLYIYGRNASRFGVSIGFVSAFKQERLQSSTPAETRYKIPMYRTGNVNQNGYLSRNKCAALFEHLRSELPFHHSKVKRIEQLHGSSMCLSVPAHGRFLQNGFDGCNSQGSEYPFIILIADPSHSSLRRQLIYTAVTRSRDKLAIVGSREALELAVKKPLDTDRRTLLQARLRGEL